MTNDTARHKYLDALTVLDDRLEELLAHCDGLNPDALHAKSGEEWSGAQILEHLYLAEQGTLGYLKSKMKTTPPRAGWGAAIRSLLLNRALRNKNKKYRAPKVIGSPSERPEYTTLAQNYRQLRVDMRRMMAEGDPRVFRRALFKHPIAGRLNMLQTLAFLQTHLDRHAEQIRERTS